MRIILNTMFLIRVVLFLILFEHLFEENIYVPNAGDPRNPDTL